MAASHLLILTIQGATPADLIRRLLVTINYGAALKKSHKDWEARIENINELISFAQSFPDEGSDVQSNDTEYNSSLPIALAADTVESGDDDGYAIPSPYRFIAGSYI
jgi:superfamily I DNA/RNA helicase